MSTSRLVLTIALCTSSAALTPAADVVWVHQLRGQEGEGTGTVPGAGEGTLAWEDDLWRALLEGAGHNIIVHDAFDNLDEEPELVDDVNSGDIVIFSRDTNSGDYNEPDEQEAWTELVTDPMIILTPFVIRSSRWDMAESAGIAETNKDEGIGPLLALEPDHPIFAGAIDGKNEAVIWDEEVLGPDDSIDFLDTFDDQGKVGNGTVLAIETSLEIPWIIHWEQGSEFYADSQFGYTAGGPRLYYSVGSDDDPFSWGEKNTTPAGDQILLNAIDWLTGVAADAGDFNGDGQLNAADLDLLSQGQRDNDPSFDLSGDGQADINDRLLWVNDLRRTWMGDSNLDGEFDSNDLVSAFQVNKFESGETANWTEGDWNGDLLFDSGTSFWHFKKAASRMGRELTLPMCQNRLHIYCSVWRAWRSGDKGGAQLIIWVRCGVLERELAFCHIKWHCRICNDRRTGRDRHRLQHHAGRSAP